jgi:CBS domain-containing protein
VATCNPDDRVKDLAEAMLDHGWENLVVLEEGNALGVVGQDELIRAYALKDFKDLTAADVLREGVPQVPPDIPLEAAAQVMLDLGVRTLYLMHHAGGIEYPAAALSYRHILRHMSADNPDTLRDLGIKAERRSPLETFIERREAARARYKKKKT